MAKTFTTREFTKNGFIRREDKDFRDDGTTFKCFEKEGLIISYTKWVDSEKKTYYYADIHMPSNTEFTYEEARESSWYDLMGEFNGCFEIDMNKFMSNIHKVAQGIKELNERVKNERPDASTLQHILDNEIEEAQKTIKFFRVNYDWFNVDSFRFTCDMKVAKRLEREIQEAKKINCNTFSNKELRAKYQFHKKYGYAFIDSSSLYTIVKNHMIQG